MQLIRDIASLHKALSSHHSTKAEGMYGIGFVPTMGALHEGHQSLVKRSVSGNTCTVCSIFVNPTQFNDPADLKKYPRMPEKDAAMLEKVGTDILFLPTEEEIYPPGRDMKVAVDFGNLTKVMEGEFRPGHFEGMAMVVRRLLEIVRPDRMYMGEKDFQQLAIVKHMVRTLQLQVEVIGCPIIREPDGLAMSSRNQLLSPAYRQKAPAIYRALLWAQGQARALSTTSIIEGALRRIRDAGLDPEYFQVVDPKTLLPLKKHVPAAKGHACTAVHAGAVRLIDNLPLG